MPRQSCPAPPHSSGRARSVLHLRASDECLFECLLQQRSGTGSISAGTKVSVTSLCTRCNRARKCKSLRRRIILTVDLLLYDITCRRQSHVERLAEDFGDMYECHFITGTMIQRVLEQHDGRLERKSTLRAPEYLKSCSAHRACYAVMLAAPVPSR